MHHFHFCFKVIISHNSGTLSLLSITQTFFNTFHCCAISALGTLNSILAHVNTTITAITKSNFQTKKYFFILFLSRHHLSPTLILYFLQTKLIKLEDGPKLKTSRKKMKLCINFDKYICKIEKVNVFCKVLNKQFIERLRAIIITNKTHLHTPTHCFTLWREYQSNRGSDQHATKFVARTTKFEIATVVFNHNKYYFLLLRFCLLFITIKLVMYVKNCNYL